MDNWITGIVTALITYFAICLTFCDKLENNTDSNGDKFVTKREVDRIIEGKSYCIDQRRTIVEEISRQLYGYRGDYRAVDRMEISNLMTMIKKVETDYKLVSDTVTNNGYGVRLNMLEERLKALEDFEQIIFDCTTDLNPKYVKKS